MEDASNKDKSEQEGTEKHEAKYNDPLSDEEEKFLLSDQWFLPKQLEEGEEEEGEYGDRDGCNTVEESAAGSGESAVRKTSREEVIQSMRRITIPKGFVHQRVKQASSITLFILVLICFVHLLTFQQRCIII